MQNEYEEARRRRVQRNEEVLHQLGLLQNPLSGAAEEAAEQRQAARQRQRAAAAAASVEQQALEPTRRSRRLQGEATENGGMNPRDQPSERQQAWCARVWRPVQADLAALEGSEDPSLDAHNVMRVRSMSDRALQTRIHRIQRVGKLLSFTKVLEACGKADLAAEAREALAAMVGCDEAA